MGAVPASWSGYAVVLTFSGCCLLADHRMSIVRRRSTVRFRNGAQISGLIRKDLNGSWMPVGTNGCPQALAARPAPFQPGHAGSSGDARQIPGSFVTEEPSAGQPAPVTAGSDMRRRLTGPARSADRCRKPLIGGPKPGDCRRPGPGGRPWPLAPAGLGGDACHGAGPCRCDRA
jgi:hypothetical protein